MTGSVATPVCSPSTRNCSCAAGLRVSREAISTFCLSRVCRRRAILAVVVVLPEPCRPTSIITTGGDAARSIGWASAPRVCTSSSWMSLMTIWPGVMERASSWPTAFVFTDAVTTKAAGPALAGSSTPGQMVIKLVHDELVHTLGAEAEPIDLAASPPVVMMLVGLQGSGKTTTSAKLGRRLQNRDKQKVLMASLDTRRPAAQEQLRVLGEQTGVATHLIVEGQDPAAITTRALQAAKLGGYDVLLLDTAGRTHIDEALMAETAEISALAKPHETLLVADALTGQDAVNLARNFDQRVALTGIVLTRIDGDGRGGAALSMRAG